MPRRAGPGRPPRRLVTLTSDVGAAYAAQMKAVLLSRLPAERLVDLAHDLRAHDIAEGAFLLRAMAERFPPGSVHLAVVDPGVGGRRAPLIVACGDGSTLVGPDNGLLMPLAARLGSPRAFRIDPARLPFHRRVGTTFDGRDLFAPAAAELALGRRPEELGRRVRPRALSLPEPRRHRDGAEGLVLHVDRFGNAVTNVPTDWVPSGTSALWLESVRRRRLPWDTRYEGHRPGELLALGSSFGLVEFSVARGSAAESAGLAVGTRVRVSWRPARRSTGK